MFTLDVWLSVSFIRHWLFIKSAFHSSYALKNKTKGFLLLLSLASCVD